MVGVSSKIIIFGRLRVSTGIGFIYMARRLK